MRDFPSFRGVVEPNPIRTKKGRPTEFYGASFLIFVNDLASIPDRFWILNLLRS